MTEEALLLIVGAVLVLGVVWYLRHRKSKAVPTRFVLPQDGTRRAPRLPELERPAESERRPETERPAESEGAPGAEPLPGAGEAPSRPPDEPGGASGNGASAVESSEGTLQLLPARLEIESGPGRGGQVRFVRLPGEEQEFTLGRAEGDPHRHVRLDSPTVSRMHARLIHRAGSWRLQNVSSTNPTVYNGRALDSSVEEVSLEDGDRIEVGEIEFVFRQPKTRDRLADRSSWYTDRGRRPVNQDAVLVKTLPDGRELAAVCDGLGSHVAGGAASHIALDALVESMSGGAGLSDAVRDANRAVLRAAEESEEREGMGTTLVAVVRKGGRYEIANVGDSRAYRIDSTGIRQITRDHSFIAEAVRDGRMSHEEATRSPWRNAVTRNLGADEEVEVDVYGGYDGTDPFLLMLCTDGVHGVLDEEEILRVVGKTRNVKDLARALGEDALVNGGKDNVAVAVVRFAAEPGGAASRD